MSCAGIHSLMMCWYVMISKVKVRRYQKRISIALKDQHHALWFAVTHKL